MFERMASAGTIDHWWIGQSDDEGRATAARLGLQSWSDAAWVICVVVRDHASLDAYYADREHREVREGFYRELPELHDLWTEHDRSAAAQRAKWLREIECAVTRARVGRLDVRLDAVTAPNPEGGALE
jgi:hypothetical protein